METIVSPPQWAELFPLYAVVNGENKKLPHYPSLGLFPLFVYKVDIIQDETGRRIETVKIEKGDSSFNKYVKDFETLKGFMGRFHKKVVAEYEEAAKNLNLAEAIILEVRNRTTRGIMREY